jgi:hypothetical protein
MNLVYQLPHCEALPTGDYTLRVPVVGRALQINCPSFRQTAALNVAVQPPEIRISRDDGEALLIDDVYPTDTFRHDRLAILGQPISQLVLRQEENSWRIASEEPLKIYDSEALRSFIELVAVFALEKGQQIQNDAWLQLLDED